jgi:hypothetical protein
MEILRLAGMFQRYFCQVQDRAVRAARAQGRSWEEIGDAIGVTRQAAWQRFSPLCGAKTRETLRKLLVESPIPRDFGTGEQSA